MKKLLSLILLIGSAHMVAMESGEVSGAATLRNRSRAGSVEQADGNVSLVVEEVDKDDQHVTFKNLQTVGELKKYRAQMEEKLTNCCMGTAFISSLAAMATIVIVGTKFVISTLCPCEPCM